MSESPPARPVSPTSESAHNNLLGLPVSESTVSIASKYHSALSSPILCATSDSAADLISFSSGDISILVTPSESLPPSPPSPPTEPKSPEFSSNRPRDAPYRTRPPIDSDCEKSPNVYINGLPPNFRDDQLLAITAPFGEIVSVRTFTRTNTKNPSGYGFVLFVFNALEFKTLAAAEKCIVALKRSDLHPSFSKFPKVNKPPRIVCSPNSPSLPTRSSSSSSLNSDRESPNSEIFKMKMAQLADEKSTNVYIEGLPLSADKNTLIELVYPHIIHSTRFIRSKLPESPTMIAFMRMESRVAAEAVILRLNGKKVRGWDDAENRVYLRIADTLDQRELRRSEASNREEEPARLSIAQATLLSYRGKDLQSNSGGGGIPIPPAIANKPDPFAAHVHELLTGNPGARARLAPPVVDVPVPSHHQPLRWPQHQQIHQPGPPQYQGIPDTLLPHPLAASIHNLLAFNPPGFGASGYVKPFPQDPLYAPYACPPPPQQLPPHQNQRQGLNVNGNLHPNVAALFESLAVLQMQQQQQRVLAQAQQQAMPMPMVGFPNQFNVGGNLGAAQGQGFKRDSVGVTAPGRVFRRVPEKFVVPSEALRPKVGGENTVNAASSRPRPSFGPPAPPVLVSGGNNAHLRSAEFKRASSLSSGPQTGLPRTASGPRLTIATSVLPPRPAPPPRANSLAGIFAKPPTTVTTHPTVPPTRLPARPLPSPPQVHSETNARPSMTTTKTTATTPPVRIQHEFNVHARANTAPVRMRRRCDSPVEDSPRLGATNGTTVVTNTTSGDTNMTAKNTNTNTHTATNTHTNTNMNNTNHKPTPSLQGADLGRAGSASRRVFLGPQNVMHLPVLRFA
ncbi:hypothetical protein B0H16DRAFT_1686077 [Mycena metata]|uniref:RRM domain-containing protein n=1 Tax=Mycena metata TaxID=1033252 RepID=A0AAD7JRH4_9AGAR|nr:hypothetical protein B0H16DRAFT_1686077 [Mycena metata]